MNAVDAHALLGLAPGADPREIKRAFRRLAMRWHPDRNPDPSALEHFKLLRAAHDALIAGDATADDAPPSAEPDAHDSRGADRRQTLTLTLDEAYAGGTRVVERVHECACDACDGTGEIALDHSRLCTACHGSGRLRSSGGLTPCHHCDGQGYRRTEACPACAGSGRVRRVRSISVRFPPGLLDGDELRLAGEGEPSATPGGRPGDLRLAIRLAPHPLFARSGRDLIVKRPVSALRLLAGGVLHVPLPGGSRHTVVLEAGGAGPRRLEIAGAGLPGRGNQPAGALIVELEPLFPSAADEALRAHFAALDDAVRADLARHLPELARWEAQWLDDATDETA